MPQRVLVCGTEGYVGRGDGKIQEDEPGDFREGGRQTGTWTCNGRRVRDIQGTDVDEAKIDLLRRQRRKEYAPYIVCYSQDYQPGVEDWPFLRGALRKEHPGWVRED